MGRQPRQRPVSCVFCRTRKLRCNRQFPCSNCTSRGVICELGTGVVPPAIAGSGESAGGVGGDALLKLLSRLDKLEKTVSDQNEELQKTRNAVFGGGLPQRSPATMSGTGVGQGAATSSTMTTTTTDTSPAAGARSVENQEPPVSTHLQRFTADALWLESGCSSEPLVDKIVSDELEFRTAPIRSITKQAAFSVSSQSQPAEGLYSATKCIFLPIRQEARYLIQKYFLEITYFHHIVHMPTLEARVEIFYNDLDAGSPVDKGVALLLICILANVCLSWTPFEDDHCPFFDQITASKQAILWTKAAMDVLDHVQRLNLLSIEGVQGATILFFVTFLIEGISRRAGGILARAIHMARDFGLHTIDKDRPGWPWARHTMSPCEKEIGRRLMWYLAATDWAHGSLSMVSEGSYLIDPRGLHVRKPLNVDDEDLTDDREIVARPFDEETTASYFLQRIRLSELFRELCFMEMPNDADPDKGPYDRVIEIDARLHRYLSELPAFFSLNFTGQTSQNFVREASRSYAGAILRRCTLHLLVHRYLCKIHLPYLARGAIDPAFSYSRRVCLESARIIIRSEAQLSKITLTSMSLRTRMTMVLRCVFLATIALVVDACVAEGPQHEDKPKAEEILEAWATLEQARKISTTAARLLELSKMVLRKQNPSHPALAALQDDIRDEQQQPPQSGVTTTLESGATQQEMSGLTATGQPADIAMMDEQWLGFEASMDVDNIDWERFFCGLDAAPFL